MLEADAHEAYANHAPSELGDDDLEDLTGEAVLALGDGAESAAGAAEGDIDMTEVASVQGGAEDLPAGGEAGGAETTQL